MEFVEAPELVAEGLLRPDGEVEEEEEAAVCTEWLSAAMLSLFVFFLRNRIDYFSVLIYQ